MEKELFFRGVAATLVSAVSLNDGRIQNPQEFIPLTPQKIVRSVSAVDLVPAPKLQVTEPARAAQSNEFVTLKEDKRWIDIVNEWREERKNNGVEISFEKANKLWMEANNYEKNPSIVLMGHKLITPQGENLYSQNEKLPFKEIVIPKDGSSFTIQTISRNPETNTWKDPGNGQAWITLDGKPYPFAVFGHRGDIFFENDTFEVGDKVFFTSAVGKGLVETVVIGKEIVPKNQQTEIIKKTNKDLMALLTCDPDNDPSAPNRLIIWLASEK